LARLQRQWKIVEDVQTPRPNVSAPGGFELVHRISLQGGNQDAIFRRTNESIHRLRLISQDELQLEGERTVVMNRAGRVRSDNTTFRYDHKRVQNAVAAVQRQRAVQLMEETRGAQKQTLQLNIRVRENNTPILLLLAAVIPALAEPPAVGAPVEDWWKWWPDYNEVYTNGDVPVYTMFQSGEAARPELPTVAPGANVRTKVIQYDCLAAESCVLMPGNVRGMIKDVVPGDYVLCANSETGWLGYQPVKRVTIRPPVALYAIPLEVGAETATLEASGGHWFWVLGKGWQRARDLQPRDVLWCPARSIRVGADGIQLGTVRVPAYNLEFQDDAAHAFYAAAPNSNIFVLTHDNTVRATCANEAPGYNAPPSLADDVPAEPTASPTVN
jgi:hypothetical protein